MRFQLAENPKAMYSNSKSHSLYRKEADTSMAKLAVLVPHQDMLALAERVFDGYPKLQRAAVEYVRTEDAARRARELEADGCDIIMARGLQAALMKHAVRLPIIEIRSSAVELGRLMLDIREELKDPCPGIAVIGFANMLCDMEQFDRLFRVKCRVYSVEPKVNPESDLRAAVREAAEAGCRAVIGGNVACREAEKRGLCTRFIPSGWESLQNAFDIARHIGYAIDLEKRNRAEITAMLDNTHSGILCLDAGGTVVQANANAFNMLNLPPRELLGRQLTEVAPKLDRALLRQALQEGQEVYTVQTTPGRRELVISISPIRLDEHIDGAILTIQEGRKVMEMSSELRHELFIRGHMARWHFADLPARSEAGGRMLRQASRVAQFQAPVLLTGEIGSGREILAQCIHNAGITRGNAFISLDCRAYQPDTLDTVLFGTVSARKDGLSSLIESAQDGTVYLSNIEYLSEELQFKLFRLTRGIFMHNGSSKPMEVNVRLIASTHVPLITKVENGSFRSDLYYAINALGITVPPIRQRREDIPGWIELYLREWKKRYDRVIHLTQGARDYLTGYDWPGNLNQLNSVCEQMMLLADRRNIDEGFLKRQIEQLTPKTIPGTEQLVIYKDERAAEIEALIRQYGGSRRKVAEALGVSKTTLWRYMKKYGITEEQ